MKGFLLLFLSLLLVNLAVFPSSTASEKNDQKTETSTTKSTASSGSPSTTAQTTVSSGSSGVTTQTTASSGSPSTTTQTTASSGSSGVTTQTTASSGSPSTTTQTTASSGSPGTTTQTTVPSGSSGVTTQTTASSGSPSTTTQTTASSGSPGTTTQTTVPSGSSDVTTQTTASSGSPGTTTQTTVPSGSSGVTTQTTASSGSPSTTAQTTVPSGSPGTTAQTTVPSGSSDVSTQTTVTPQSPQTNSAVTNPGPSDLCKSNTCGKEASCVNMFSDYYCLCPQGYYYQDLSCVKGKTFPGEIGVNMSESLELKDENSKVYQDFHNSVIKFFASALNKSDFGFGQTIILKVSASPSLSARSAMGAAEETIYVSVVNMFDENTSQNETTISAAIASAIKESKIVKSYTNQDVCDFFGCEKNDNCQNAFQCQCKPGYIRLNKLTFCVPSAKCNESCSAQEGKQCLKNSMGRLECVCMPGYQKITGNKCEKCPFGYSGTDCKDQFQLILTIVGTIAGALILILLIALIVSVSSKKKKKNVEEQKLIEDDFRNMRLQQAGFSNSGFSNSGFSNSSFSNFGGDSSSIFPKVRTGVPSQTQNPYANQRSMARPDY